MKYSLLLPAILLVAVTTSAAQDGATPQHDSLQAVKASQPRKNMAVAYALALGATAAPIVTGAYLQNKNEDVSWSLIGLGVVIGPSVGEFYADSYGLAVVGMTLRTFGFVILASNKGGGLPGFTDVPVIAALIGAGTVFSLVETAFAVNRANKQETKTSEPRASLSPVLYPTSDKRFIPGLMARVSF